MHALEVGLANLGRHITNMQKYGLPTVVALNRFPTDRDDEIDLIGGYCRAKRVRFAVCEGFAKGGEGAVDLAYEVCAAIERDENHFKLLYADDLTVQDKIEAIAREIYGADGVDYAPAAKTGLKKLEALGAERLQVCIAKTQYSLSDNPALLGAPEHFRLQVREIRPSLGAGFVVAVTGDIMTMPGLPKTPAALSIDIDGNGNISGLF
jgi:formate--tetrahydrofolate ligase